MNDVVDENWLTGKDGIPLYVEPILPDKFSPTLVEKIVEITVKFYFSISVIKKKG